MDKELNTALTAERVSEFRDAFYSDRSTKLAQNVVSRSDPLDACLVRKALETKNHVFSNKVDEVKPVTNQRSSGRCWLFACLNVIRIPFIKEKNLDDFEFSQGYLFFWDKLERCNYFLTKVVEVSKREPKESPDGRLMSFLLDNPTCDGGQWDMVVNIIKKYGVMPKKCFPEAFSCESSRRMNDILKTKLREFCFELRTMVEENASDEKIAEKIRSQMNVIYRVVGICLGIPPTEFTWEYYDKSKKYQKLGPISPLEFYEQHVKPAYDIESKVCLVSDPRPRNPTGNVYVVDCLGNMVGGRPTIYNNQPIETLLQLASETIKDKNEAVWFGCDVGKHMASKQGLLDIEAHDHELVFGTKIHKVLTKADRLIYGDSQMNHAMVLTGVHFDGNDTEPKKWRVENSWGEDRNEKGYLVMTSEWFKEFVFEVVVDKSVCPPEVLQVFESEPRVLPAWDPMGALARD